VSRTGWAADYLDPFTFLGIFYTPRGRTQLAGGTRSMLSCWIAQTERQIISNVMPSSLRLNSFCSMRSR
jgi:hypothetical protein